MSDRLYQLKDWRRHGLVPPKRCQCGDIHLWRNPRNIKEMNDKVLAAFPLVAAQLARGQQVIYLAPEHAFHGDDVSAPCQDCGRTVYHRPQLPKTELGPVIVCAGCAGLREFGAEAQGRTLAQVPLDIPDGFSFMRGPMAIGVIARLSGKSEDEIKLALERHKTGDDFWTELGTTQETMVEELRSEVARTRHRRGN